MNKDEHLEQEAGQQAAEQDLNNTTPEAENTSEAEAQNAEGEKAEATAEETPSPEAELAVWKDKYLRLHAEFDNFRKRSHKEKADLIANASAGMIKEMLPVIDDFDRAIAANESNEDLAAVKEGFGLIQHKMLHILSQKGLTPMDSKGKPFNVDEHEALTQIPAPSEDLKGKVVDVIEKGYLLNDRILRYAKVVVGQ